jgi:dTDP-4-amino-4,6-dideoxygalactose transaminase
MHGSAPKYHHRFVGGNFRLDPVQAVVLTIKLRHLPEWHAARRENALLYDELFHAHGLVDDGFVVPPRTVYSELAEEAGAPADHHVFNQYVIRAKNRDNLVRHLQSRQVGVEIYYPIPLHKQECVATLGYNALSFPESEKASAETLALPIYPELTDAMQEYVVDQIKAFYRE